MAQLTVCVTVDWEGISLEEKDLVAMAEFRRHFDFIPLTHFICPAYFARGGGAQTNQEHAEKIKKQVFQGFDEVGLHVHAWHYLVQGAGVKPKVGIKAVSDDDQEPKVPYLNSNGQKCADGREDTGFSVPLGVYEPDEISVILQFAKNLLVEHELGQLVKSFRCGGWLASDSVIEALGKVDLLYDSSATDAAFFGSMKVSLLDDGNYLGDWLARLWGDEKCEDPSFLKNSLSLQSTQSKGIDGNTQPYKIRTTDHKIVTEVPDNALLIDYLNEKDMFVRLVSAWKKAQGANHVLVCGFHQETAAACIDKLASALDKFLAIEGGIPIKFKTVETVAESMLLS
jgi:hypothetical protein